MDILILSKTHMNGKCCVGGITGIGQYVRLMTSLGENQPENTDLVPRRVYNIDYKEKKGNKPPHVEDVLIVSKKLKGTLKGEIKIIDFIKQRKIIPWTGSPESLFDGKLKWTDNGSGFINNDAIPDHSVGFWIPDQDLNRITSFDKTRYVYGGKSFPYVGFDEAVETIPAGTLVRVSLARWWDTKGTTELRCSLQLSGWYDLNINQASAAIPSNNLPF